MSNYFATGDFPHYTGTGLTWDNLTWRQSITYNPGPIVLSSAETIEYIPPAYERCQYCRTKHKHDDKFCDGCGAPL